MYEWWLSQGYFKPEKYWEFHDPNPKHPAFVSQFLLRMLPGFYIQVTLLHFSLEDLIIRYERMKQKQALYVPGTDHAGIQPKTWWNGN